MENTPIEPINNKEQTQVNERDFNGFVKGLFVFFLATSAINSVSKLVTNLTWGNTTLGIIMFLCEAACCYFIYVMLQKKSWGLLALFGMLLLQIPSNLILGNPNMESVYISTFIRIGIFSLLLLIPKNGVTGWQLLFSQSDEVIDNHDVATKTIEGQGGVVVDEVEPVEIVSLSAAASTEGLTPEPEEDASSSPQPEPVVNVVNAAAVAVEPDRNIVQDSDNIREKKSTFFPDVYNKGLSKWLKIGIATICCLLIAIGIFALVVALKSYPEYITSFGDKWKYTLDRPNDKLANRMLGELEEYQYKGQFFFDREDGAIVEASNFYKSAGSFLNHLQGSKSYLVKDTVRSESEIDSSALYTARWSYGYKWAKVGHGEGEGSYDYNKMIANDPDLVFIKVEPVDLQPYLNKEEEVVQIVTTIPARDMSLIKTMVNHYVNVENYNRAVDVVEFYLPYNKKNTDLLGLASFVHYKNKDYDKAEEYAEKALSINPKTLQSIEVKSYVAAESLEWENAMRLAKKAIDYGSENADMYFIYSKSVFKQGEKKLANEYYNKAYKMNRFSPFAEKYKECGGCPVEIESISVGNIKSDGTVITDYGDKIYSSKTQYLAPKIYFTQLREDYCETQVKLYRKGKLETGYDSPSGYTYDATIYPWKLGKNEQVLSGWGSSSSGTWSAGNYRFEIWYQGDKIAEERFTVY